ncbi:MAG: hypothetical protein Q4C08_00165 [Pseudomonadota bacterium]|nr:hypothetical protein [Pseudomonadota bacterium]
MKKILTASLVAMMAVTAANADIASTQYVNKKLTGDAENGTLSFTGAAAQQTTLQGAVNAIADSLSQNLGEGGNVSQQIESAIQGLTGDVTGSGVVTDISQTNGKVTAKLGKIGDAQVDAISQSKITDLTKDLGDRQLVDNIVPESGIAAEANKVDTKYPSVNAAYAIAADATRSLTTGLGSLQGAVGANDTNTFKTNMANTAYLKQSGTAVAAVKALDGVIEGIETDLTNQKDAKVEGSFAAQIAGLQVRIGEVAGGDLTAGSVEGTAIKNGTITETQLNNTVNASLDLADSALQKADIATGTTNGTIKVEDTEVAVAGLGTAAYKADTAFDVAGAANTAEGNAKSYTDGQIQLLTAETEVVGTNDGSYVTAVSQTDGKIQVSTVAFDTALNADSTNAVQNKVVNTAIEGIKTTLGGLNGKQIANVPESCATGGTGTCSLVMKNGVATWEVVEY